MKALITRTGGIAGLTMHREVELSETDLVRLREHDGERRPVIPDSFTYDVTANGNTFTVRGERATSWLETLLREE